MSRIIGCQSLYFAEVTKDDSTGSTFGTPFAVPSLTSIEIKDNADSVTFYSDDTTEQVIPTFSGKEVTIELGYISNELEAKLTGQTYKSGVLVQKANFVSKEYAMMFKAPKSKGGFQYVVLYKGAIARSESAYKSKEDSIEGQTVTLTGTFMPLLSNNLVGAKADDSDSDNTDLISTWFTKVPVPSDLSRLSVEANQVKDTVKK